VPACAAGEFCLGGACASAECQDAGACTLPDAGSGMCCGPQGLTCLDGTTNLQNCGQCNAPCGPSQDCNDGTCVASDCSATTNAVAGCPLGDDNFGSCCNGQCVVLGCTECGETCPGGTACGAAFTCAWADAGLASCLAAAPCPAGLTCSPKGLCIVPASACSVSTLGSVCAGSGSDDRCCGTSCVDLASDNSNCGECGTACGQGKSCHQGQCS
jgi:hypothetical protein